VSLFPENSLLLVVFANAEGDFPESLHLYGPLAHPATQAYSGRSLYSCHSVSLCLSVCSGKYLITAGSKDRKNIQHEKTMNPHHILAYNHLMRKVVSDRIKVEIYT